MRDIKLTITYDRAEFHGWQLQPGIRAIHGSLIDAACKITQEKILIHGASRTDAGVHPLGQVAHSFYWAIQSELIARYAV